MVWVLPEAELKQRFMGRQVKRWFWEALVGGQASETEKEREPRTGVKASHLALWVDGRNLILLGPLGPRVKHMPPNLLPPKRLTELGYLYTKSPLIGGELLSQGNSFSGTSGWPFAQAEGKPVLRETI